VPSEEDCGSSHKTHPQRSKNLLPLKDVIIFTKKRKIVKKNKIYYDKSHKALCLIKLSMYLKMKKTAVQRLLYSGF
jgi:hypothetical protein